MSFISLVDANSGNQFVVNTDQISAIGVEPKSTPYVFWVTMANGKTYTVMNVQGNGEPIPEDSKWNLPIQSAVTGLLTYLNSMSAAQMASDE